MIRLERPDDRRAIVEHRVDVTHVRKSKYSLGGSYRIVTRSRWVGRDGRWYPEYRSYAGSQFGIRLAISRHRFARRRYLVREAIAERWDDA